MHDNFIECSGHLYAATAAPVHDMTHTARFETGTEEGVNVVVHQLLQL